MTDRNEKALEFRRGWPVLLAATLGAAAGLSSIPFYSLGTFIAPLQVEFGWGRYDVALVHKSGFGCRLEWV